MVRALKLSKRNVKQINQIFKNFENRRISFHETSMQQLKLIICYVFNFREGLTLLRL